MQTAGARASRTACLQLAMSWRIDPEPIGWLSSGSCQSTETHALYTRPCWSNARNAFAGRRASHRVNLLLEPRFAVLPLHADMRRKQ